jgi:hypothetical protein
MIEYRLFLFLICFVYFSFNNEIAFLIGNFIIFYAINRIYKQDLEENYFDSFYVEVEEEKDENR